MKLRHDKALFSWTGMIGVIYWGFLGRRVKKDLLSEVNSVLRVASRFRVDVHIVVYGLN